MPNSLVWIGLVVVWIFVLFPMVTGRRKPVRRTGEATLATRVLHRGGMARPMRRGPAAGHAGDPDWVPTAEQERARHRQFEHPDTTRAEAQMDSGTTRSGGSDVDDEILDAEVVEDEAGGRVRTAHRSDSAAGTVHGAAHDEDAGAGRPDEDGPDADARGAAADRRAADAEPVASGPADGSEPTVSKELDTVDSDAAPRRTGRGGFDPRADAIASAERYRTRQRVVLSMAGGIVVTAVFALLFLPLFWWGTAAFAGAVTLYLGYLRRQVRLEEQIRRRRMARLQKARTQEQVDRRARATVPGPPQRRGVVVLESDDGDPDFEHLPPYAPAAHEDLRHASGQ
ncbi:divisome protein SepX/GlpR [Tomitella gaofuii]|uniref:divisome protein SepX/GlpR n=1 Tax=Tomitella gaofuii TaxID=2760083 RepID=UPI0015F7C257|nr:gephyrin-like molybdotransferase receptor GlpR [Tomitella gaofuii]